MIIKRDKDLKKISISVYRTNIVWILDPVSTEKQVKDMITEDTHLVIFSTEKPLATGDELAKWDNLSQEYKKKDVVLAFTPGEFQLQDIDMKGSSLDEGKHFVIETPEGNIGLINSKVSDSFIKQYAPIDVLIGKGTYLASVQLDFEPFFVVMPSMSDDYKAAAGVSEVKKTDKINIKKINHAARGISATTEVYTLS